MTSDEKKAEIFAEYSRKKSELDALHAERISNLKRREMRHDMVFNMLGLFTWAAIVAVLAFMFLMQRG